eukprot:14841905-Ditylum_brightwellii.AAC.1
MDLADVVMDVKQDPASSWKAMGMLEQGLQHHHTANRSVHMTKQDVSKAKTDKENAEGFANHFSKVFNNPDLLPCNAPILLLVVTCSKFSKLITPPDYGEVKAAITHVANGKSQ